MSLCDWLCRNRINLVPGFKDLREQTTLRPFGHYGRFFTFRRYQLVANFQMTDSQQVTMTVAFTDKRGNPAPAPAGAQPPAWAVDNPNLLKTAPATDGLSAVVTAVGPLGSGTVSVKVTDASGNALATGSIDVTIVGGAPTNVAITPGAPSEQP